MPVAIFGATSSAAVYQGAPLDAAPVASPRVFGGLANGQPFFFGLAVDQGGGSYAPVGAILRVTPRAPIHVDVDSIAASPDGASPATAFPTLSQGVQAAVAAGGGNVWIAAGEYVGTAIDLPSNVHLFGGFDASFQLATRDPAASPTRLLGQAGSAIVAMAGGGDTAVLDGLELDGGASAAIGVDVDETDAELRSLVVRRATSRGIRLRSLVTSHAIDVAVVRCRISENAAQGLSLEGAFRLVVEGSRFQSNGAEGLDLPSLLAPDGIAVSLRVRDSSFDTNGTEGLDCTMTAPLGGGASGGSYEVTILGSRFDSNGWTGSGIAPAGLEIDVDYENEPLWRSTLLLRGSRAVDNRGPGVHLDFDGPGSAAIHRLSANANRGDGLLVTSEPAGGFVTVSASVCSGNLGAGMRAVGGNFPLVVSHSIVAGNALGGIRSEFAESSAVSSVAWLQPTPWTGTRLHHDVVATDPSLSPFDVAPIAYRRALALSGATLTLDDATGVMVNERIEIADDGVARAVTALGAANHVEVLPAPAAIELPAGVSVFPAASPVDEDWQLAPGSAAEGAGMAQAGGGSVDAGIFGAPLGGDPGTEPIVPPVLFRASSSTPPVTATLSANQAIRIDFEGGDLAPASVGVATVRVIDAGGTPLAVTRSVQSGSLLITPVGAWPSGDLLIELHAGLQSTSGTSLASPVTLPLRAS
ncbi:MAG: hypothetical protein ACKVXR_00975 [Planctomycetota bacterium]